MVEITNELMYEVVKQIQDRVGHVDRKVDVIRSELGLSGAISWRFSKT